MPSGSDKPVQRPTVTINLGKDDPFDKPCRIGCTCFIWLFVTFWVILGASIVLKAAINMFRWAII